MQTTTYIDRGTMSRAAARHASRALREAIAARGSARIVAATGASQFEFLDALTAGADIDWTRVELFHLDEYVGLPLDHPASVRKYLLERLIIKVMVRAKGPRRTILVTDAIAAAGGPPGRYRMGAVKCDLGADGRVSLPGTAYLAGSSLTMDRAIANVVRFTELPIEEVIPMASTVPATYLGMTTAGTVTADWDAEAGTLGIQAVRV